MPLGGFIARHAIMEWPHGTHTSTFGGNPVACAAALATLDVLEEENLIDNAVQIGEHLLSGLQDLCRQPTSPPIRVCGKGLMICLELESSQTALTLLTAAYKHGLLLLAAGKQGVRLAPPLVVTAEEATVALRILEKTCADLEEKASQGPNAAST
jgi:4-aminobutyrate aminotransferase